jgi:hypothetical protein
MGEQSELFDIVEPDFHWLASCSIMPASRVASSASDNISTVKKQSLIPVEKASTVVVSKCRENPQKEVGFARPRACCPLFPAPEHIYGESQVEQEEYDSRLFAELGHPVKEIDSERPPRRILFDCVDTPPYRRGLPGPNVDFVTGKPIPYYVPFSVHDKTALFESRFESGNLKRATQIGPFEYELLLKPDSNTSGYMQWFYFSISKLTQGSTVRLNIINMYKPKSLFGCGMRPLMYSSIRAASHNIGWVRCGKNIKYFETQTSGYEGLHTLSFEFEVQEADDVLYIAQCFPFTWSYQQKYLSDVLATHESKGIVKRELLCESLNGNRCDVLIITDFGLEQSSADQVLRPCIFLTARVHPGESNSSWIMKGIIDHLLGDTDVAKALRARFYVVLVPMLNPDGVINGNYRCDLAGFDLNRNWKNPDPTRHRTIFATKQLMQSIQQSRELFFFCDFHGHSTKNNVFMYGCECENGPQKLMEMVFPCIMSRIAGEAFNMTKVQIDDLIFGHQTGVFSFGDSSFKMKKEKESTARVVVRRQFNITHSYTLEASIFGCNFGPHSGQHFSVDVCVHGTSFSNIIDSHFPALSGHWSQSFRCNHALVKPRQRMDRRISGILEKSVWRILTCDNSVYSHCIFCRYSEKHCDTTVDSEKHRPVVVSAYSATKSNSSALTLATGAREYFCTATPPVTKRLLSGTQSRSILRQPLAIDPGTVRVAVNAAKKK